MRDISAEIAEARRMMAEFLGRELRLPDRPSRLIHLWVVVDDTDEIVGNAAREVGLRGSALVVAHKQLRIRRPEWRRRRFGSALLADNRDWYRECGVQFIVMEAEGDGSAFAASRGFDLDLTSYANRPGFKGLTERASVVAFLERVKASGAEPARQVERFQQRLPQSPVQAQGTVTGDELTFTAPEEIASFGENEPLDVLSGQNLGPAVLARTGWSGISTL